MRPPRLQYALLVLVAAVSLTAYLASAIASLERTYDPTVPRIPMYFGFHLDAVSGVTPEAYNAGVRWGDRVTAINGRPFTGYEIYLEELRQSKAGSPLSVTFIPRPSPSAVRNQPENGNTNFPGHRDLTEDGAPRTVSINLLPETPQPPGFFHQLTELYFLEILFPLGCLLLGIWVVASKPEDRNAWFMLGILAYFSAIFTSTSYWAGSLYFITGFYGHLMEMAGPLSIMLFGIYFPERGDIDRRFPWIKWILILLVSALATLNVIWFLGFGYSFASVVRLSPIFLKYYQTQTFVEMAAISLYFFSIARKTFKPGTLPDLRRRLQIIYWGSFLGCVPMTGVVIFSMVTGRDFGDGIPGWIFLAALLTFTIFPLSLVYVVVVQRALELRSILRIGSQYFLARSGMWIIRIALGTAIGFSIGALLSHRPFRLGDEIKTLALVALFVAWRFRAAKSISTWIDRKFFRESYSADQILAQLANQVQTFTDTKPLMQTVASCIGDALHVERIAILLRTGDVFRLQLANGIDLGPGLENDLMLSAGSNTISALTNAKGSTPNLRFDNPQDWAVAATEAERSALKNLGAEILIPLQGRNKLIGVLALGPKRSEEPYSRTDRSLLQSVALHTGLSIENTELVRSLATEAAQRERINREIEIAREVQERMFPQSLPVVPGLDLAGHCRPALGVGGDYYDFFELKERSDGSTPLGVAIGDVSGKGVSAALLMASLRASLRGMTRNTSGDLATVMSDINQLVFEASASNRYATFFYAQYDPRHHLLSFVNAGHNAPMLIRPKAGQPNGSVAFDVLRLELSGPVVGLLRDAEFEQSNLPILPGDILFAFTDGISESMTSEEEEWGEERMIECLTANAALSAAELLQALLDEATSFAAGAPQYDDMTLLVCKFDA